MICRAKHALSTGLAVCSITLAVASPPAFAQKKTKASVLEEVIVTAQRREQNAQEVSISVTVFDQEQINNANMVNTADLALYTPSLSVKSLFGPENAAFNIRGFSKELRTTATVGTYFAEVVAPRGQILQTSGDGAGPGTMFDLQNIQVLKGPQGTLFGRNTTGGAVLMAPQKPTDVFEGYVELSAGNFELRQQRAVVNLPVHERVRLRLGVDNKEREGHLTNITGIGAGKLGNVDYTAGRLSLVVDITDSLENYTVVNYADSDTNGYGSRIFTCNPDATFEALRPGACQDQLDRQRSTGQDGFYDVVSTVPDPRVAIEDLRAINHLTWDITDSITIKNILAYMHLETLNSQDVFGTQFIETQGALIGIPLPGGIADPNREFLHGYSIPHPEFPVTSQESRVAELQVQGRSFNDRLDWQTGVYYENSEPDGFSGNISPSTLSCDLNTIATGDPSQYNCFDALAGRIGGVTHQALKTEYTNKAAYGQATFDILEQLSLTTGVRYTWDRMEGFAKKTRYTFAGSEQQEPIVIEQSPVQESEAPTGLLELQYRPFQTMMLYVKYVRGYRQGGVNTASDPGIDTHEKETVDMYEIGAKTEFDWPIPGRFNFAVFDNDLTDMQLQSGFLSPTSGTTTAIFNAGKARIKGFEFDGFFQLLERLTAHFSYSYLDTELLEQETEENRRKVEEAAGSGAGDTFTPSAVVGDELPFTPERSYTLGLDYRLPLPTSIGEISVGATYAHTGEQRVTASTSSPSSVLDGFSVLNFNVNWANMFDKPWNLSLFATNVRDEEYITFQHGSFNSLGFESRSVGQPRMYGARLTYSFGPSSKR